MLAKDVSLEQLAIEAGRACLTESKDSAVKAVDKLYEAAKKAGMLDDFEFRVIFFGMVRGFYKGRFGNEYAPPTLVKIPG